MIRQGACRYDKAGGHVGMIRQGAYRHDKAGGM